MANSDFRTTFLVDQSPKEAYNAINNVDAWWQGEIKGKSNKINDEFTYRMDDIHFSIQKVIELIPNKKVAWLVTDSKLAFTKNKSEWTGTEIVFEISEKKNKTEVCFTHKGLVPKCECYSDCSNAWTQLVQKSLVSLITTGKGKKVF